MAGQYGAMPPEVNAAMIEGVGAGSLLAAGTAMGALGAALAASAAVVSTTVTTLAGAGWAGPSGTAVAASFVPNVGWMSELAAQCATIGAKHAAFAAAYQAANATIPKVPVVVENQAEHVTLQATNFLGINTASIAANRALYQTYWDVAAGAMQGYEAVGAVESAPLPAAPPPPITSGVGIELAATGVSMGVELGVGLASGAMNAASAGLSSMGMATGAAAAAPAGLTALGNSGGSAPGGPRGFVGLPGPPTAASTPSDGGQLNPLLSQLPQAASALPQMMSSNPTQGVSSAFSGPLQSAMGPLQSLMSGNGAAGLGGANPFSGSGLNGLGNMAGIGLPTSNGGNGGDGERSAARSAGLMRSAALGGGGYTMPGGWRTTAASVGIGASAADPVGSGRAVGGGADLRGSAAGAAGSPGMYGPISAGRGSSSGRAKAALSWEEDPFGAEEPAELPMVLAAAAMHTKQ